MIAVWKEADQIELRESAWSRDHLYPFRAAVASGNDGRDTCLIIIQR